MSGRIEVNSLNWIRLVLEAKLDDDPLFSPGKMAKWLNDLRA